MLWFWGLAGAFIYAATALLVGLFESRTTGDNLARWKHAAEFAVALATGAISAEAFTPWALALPWVGAFISNDGDLGRIHGIATMIGLLANSAAPEIVKALNKRIVKQIEGKQ